MSTTGEFHPQTTFFLPTITMIFNGDGSVDVKAHWLMWSVGVQMFKGPKL